VGSIGVISAGFGAHVFLARQGVERRVYTAGKSKSMLDPFLPEKKEDVARLKDLLDQMHETFIAQVKSRRGDRLAKTRTCSPGEFWLGARAVELGLVDGIGHPRAQAQGALRRQRALPATAANVAFSSGLARRWPDAMGAIEERAAYARFGL
jgi:ClpP class serine protease